MPTKPQADAEGSLPSDGAAKSPDPTADADQSTQALTRDEVRAAGEGGSGAGPDRPLLAPLQMLAGRYRVLRFIARGAMGEVYEVEDTVLQGRLALKTIRPEIASAGKVVERFKREIALSRRVTHPNVCRMYDIGVEPAGEGSSEVLFLTMELLIGESLAARLSRRKRLSCAEALPILGQIAAGLEAAHAAGVIHRDLKSGNVMLVRSADSSLPERVVVTDFGLARSVVPAPSATASLSDTGALIGSPAYMAPEQVEGGPLTPAADLYALGIIAYELVTGMRPFDGGSAMSVAARRLTTPPPPPRSVVADLDPGWETVILKCLSLAPADRYPSPGAFVRALRAETLRDEPTLAAALPSLRRMRWTTPAALAAATLLVALSASIVLHLVPGREATREPARPTTATPLPARRVVAVLGPANASGGTAAAWLSSAVAEVLRADLASGGQLRVLPPREVSLASSDLGLSATAALDADTAARLHRRLSADLLVSGSYVVMGAGDVGLVRLHLQVQGAADPAPLASASATGTDSQVVDLVTRACGPLRLGLGLPPLDPLQALQVEASLPRDRAAVRHYAEGIGHIRDGDLNKAVAAFQATLAIEPKHAFASAALAGAWTALGDDARALAASRAAVSAAERLTPEDRLALEARLHVASRDWAKAAESYRALASLHADDPEPRLQLADVQIRGGRAREALVTLGAEGDATDHDPRLSLARARAFMELGDFPAMQAAARAAADGARARGAKGLLAQARLAESSALLSRGEAAAASAAGDEARRLFDATGDRSGAARALEAVAVAVESSGDLGGARKLHERALEVHQALGDSLSAARVLNNLGRLAMTQGRVDEAQRQYEAGLAIFRRVGARTQAGFVLINLGAQLQNAGRLEAAQTRYAEALALFSESGEKSGLAMALTNLGEIAFVRGDLGQAQRMHEESLATNREIGERSGQAYDLYRLGEVAAARGDLVVARERLQEAMAAYLALTDKVGRYSTQVCLAQVTLDQGDARQALRLARESEEVLRAEGVRDARARALLVAAEASLAVGDGRAALTAIAEAEPLVASGEDRVLGLDHAIVRARIRALSAEAAAVEDALATLTRVAADARTTGLAQVDLRARLVAAQIERSSGRAVDARRHLDVVAREARSRGLGLIARKAAAPM